MSELVTKLEALSQEELLAIAKILGPLLDGVKKPKVKPKVKSKRGRPKKVAEPQPIDDEDDSEPEPQQRRRAPRQIPKKPGAKGIPARVEPIQLGKKLNLFLKSKDRLLHKEDTKIDRKLSGKNKITERKTRTTTIKTVCKVCGKTFTVNPILLTFNDDENEYTYTCNSCIIAKE